MTDSNQETQNQADREARRQRSGVIIFVVALVVLFALVWGPGSSGCQKFDSGAAAAAAATVNGKEISTREFASQYSAMAQQYRAQGIPPEMLKQFGLHKQALDSLVNSELLSQAAESRGLTASDDEVRDQLFKNPNFFKPNGNVFDSETYESAVTGYYNMTPQAFEARLRRQLAAQKLLSLVESSVVVSDDEVRARYQKEGNSAKMTFVRFLPTMYSDKVGTPKPAELDTWVKAHEADIAQAYEAEKFRFFVAERVKARQLFLKVDKDAPAAKKAEVQQRIEQLRKELTDNKKPFAELAKSFSEDVETKEKGGDLGFVERAQLPGAFADVLFALQPGEFSKAVETPLGWHLGVVEEKKAPEQRPLEAVKTELAAQLYVKEKAKDLAKADAQKALAEAKKGKALTDLFPAAKESEKSGASFNFAAEAKPEAKETGEFNSSAESVPVLGAAPEVMRRVFAKTSTGLIDELMVTSDSVVLATVTERKQPTDDDFAKQKSQLTQEALKAKQFEVREAFIKALKQGSQVVNNDQAINGVIEG
jgi:peptidyl-prolyl cis-trans isomerase D